MRRSLLLILILGCEQCAPLQAPVLPDPEPSKPTHYMIPIDAKGTDLVCAETLKAMLFDFCISVRDFRLASLPSTKAEP